MNFKAVFTKQVLGCENEEDDPYAVRLVHVLELPFVPVEDMWFTDGDWTDFATSVDWNVQEQAFRVSTPQDDEIEQANMRGKDHRPLAAVVADYVRMGWEIEVGKKPSGRVIGGEGAWNA